MLQVRPQGILGNCHEISQGVLRQKFLQAACLSCWHQSTEGPNNHYDMDVAYGREWVDSAAVFESALRETLSAASSRFSVPQIHRQHAEHLATVELWGPAGQEAPHGDPAMHDTSACKTVQFSSVHSSTKCSQRLSVQASLNKWALRLARNCWRLTEGDEMWWSGFQTMQQQ